MTLPSGVVKLTSEHRLFETMRNLIVIVDALFVAISAAKEGANWRGLSIGVIPFKSKQFGINAYLPVGAPMRNIVNGQPIRTIWMPFFLAKDAGPPLRKTAYTVKLPHRRIFENMFTPLYVDFFERNRPWIEARFGGDCYKWPPLFNFARAIRNWMSHNEGYVSFTNKNAGPVTWHHLSYGPADEGRSVIGGD